MNNEMKLQKMHIIGISQQIGTPIQVLHQRLRQVEYQEKGI